MIWGYERRRRRTMTTVSFVMKQLIMIKVLCYDRIYIVQVMYWNLENCDGSPCSMATYARCIIVFNRDRVLFFFYFSFYFFVIRVWKSCIIPYSKYVVLRVLYSVHQPHGFGYVWFQCYVRNAVHCDVEIMCGKWNNNKFKIYIFFFRIFRTDLMWHDYLFFLLFPFSFATRMSPIARSSVHNISNNEMGPCGVCVRACVI